MVLNALCAIARRVVGYIASGRVGVRGDLAKTQIAVV